MPRSRISGTTSPMEQVNLIGKLADLKEQHYQNTLALTSLLELLMEKGIITRQEIQATAARLDALTPPEANPMQ